jgi:hypothetical protein
MRAQRRLSLALAVLVLLAGRAAVAQQRASGLQITPDGKRVLLSKDVGGSRWAITRNFADGSVTGNVFDTAGGDPTFLFCVQRSATIEDVQLGCYAASRCTTGPCGGVDFQLLADVTLPQSFFLPADALPAPTATPAAGAARVAAADERTSGLQITPDTLRTLISKDLSGQRWAITRNADDDTVTGNVYRDAGEPLFVWCTQKDGAGVEVELSCSGASSCAAGGCQPADFAFIADVTLPRSFFTPPPAPARTPPATCGNGRIDAGEDCDGSDLGDLDCSDATDAGLDCSGTLACRADCTYELSACDCPCDGDLDCGVPIDCDPIVAACTLDGACVAGRCVTARTGTADVCLGADPLQPGAPRADQCTLP